MYRQMDIWVPGRESGTQQSRTTGRDLRKLLARLNTEHQIGLPPQFFGYDESGAPDFTARPNFMLGENSRDSVRIVAIGPEASQTLLETSGPIQAALIRDYKTLVHATMRGGAHAIEPTGGNGYARCRYHAHRIVVGKTTFESWWWRSAAQFDAVGQWSARDHLRLADLIATGIFEQARTLLLSGDEVEGEMGEWLERCIATEEPKVAQMMFTRRLGVQVESIAGYTAHRATGPRGLRVMLKGVEFTMAAHMQGPWVVGRNRIEGNGLIRMSRNQRPVTASMQATSEAA